MPNPVPPNRITKEEMRQLFNDNYLEKIRTGRLNEVVMRGAEKHPSPAPAHEPFCTKSQTVSYRDPQTGDELARCHRFLRTDGSLGASGMPDPKRVYIDGVQYRIVKTSGR